MTYEPALIDRCRQGDRQALSQVFRGEMPYLERVLARVLGPSSDIEDLMQQTMEQAIHAFRAYRGEASVRTWLTRIAVRGALHHLHHPAQKRRVALELIEGGLSTDRAPLDHDVEARTRLRLVYEHLGRLQAKHRTSFVLYQFEGRSMEEVAALMDSGLSATKSRVMWARRKLYAALGKDPRTRAWASEFITPMGDEP